MPKGNRGWITNRNWVITTPMEAGIAPRSRAIRALEQIGHRNVGRPRSFSVCDRETWRRLHCNRGTGSLGEQLRPNQRALWYMDRRETFNLSVTRLDLGDDA